MLLSDCFLILQPKNEIILSHRSSKYAYIIYAYIYIYIYICFLSSPMTALFSINFSHQLDDLLEYRIR